MKTAIYLRVSTDKQESSELMQSEKCLNYCSMKGYDVVDVFVDSNVSGKTKMSNRPAGSKLLEAIDRKEIDNVVIWKLDRLSRNVVDGLGVINDFNSKCVTFSILDMAGETLDTSSPMGKLMVTMMLALGELEADTTRDRVTKALKHKKESMKVYSGNTPFGFTSKGKDLIVNPKEMEIVKKIFALREDKVPFREIRKVTQLGLSKIHRIVNDEFYERFV